MNNSIAAGGVLTRSKIMVARARAEQECLMELNLPNFDTKGLSSEHQHILIKSKYRLYGDPQPEFFEPPMKRVKQSTNFKCSSSDDSLVLYNKFSKSSHDAMEVDPPDEMSSNENECSSGRYVQLPTSSSDAESYEPPSKRVRRSVSYDHFHKENSLPLNNKFLKCLRSNTTELESPNNSLLGSGQTLKNKTLNNKYKRLQPLIKKIKSCNNPNMKIRNCVTQEKAKCSNWIAKSPEIGCSVSFVHEGESFHSESISSTIVLTDTECCEPPIKAAKLSINQKCINERHSLILNEFPSTIHNMLEADSPKEYSTVLEPTLKNIQPPNNKRKRLPRLTKKVKTRHNPNSSEVLNSAPSEIAYNDSDDCFNEDVSSSSEYVPSSASTTDSDSNEPLVKAGKPSVTSNCTNTVDNLDKIEILNSATQGETGDSNSLKKSADSCDQYSKYIKRQSKIKKNQIQYAACDSTSDLSVKFEKRSEYSSSLLQYSVTVDHAKKKKDGRRLRDKRHSCCFCHKLLIHPAKHFEVAHSKEKVVAQLLSMPPKSQNRVQGLLELIRVGNFYHNCEVVAANIGELILVRRPTTDEIQAHNFNHYGPCPNCLGFMLKRHLWHHLKGCPARKSNFGNDIFSSRHVIAESSAMLYTVSGNTISDDFSQNVVDSLRNDVIGEYCKQDKLILHFGAMLFAKYGYTQKNFIRQLMRQLSRLTLELKSSTVGNLSLSDFMVPERFDDVVAATKKICGSMSTTATERPKFDTPSFALKIGHSLKKCANMQKCVAIKQNNQKWAEALNSFIVLLELEWHIKISSNALATLYERKLNAGQLLPITEDIKQLTVYIDKEITEVQSFLKKTQTALCWNRLCTLTCRLILFNKRRAGEASKITLTQYVSRPSWTEQTAKELKSSLTTYELHLTEKLELVYTMGKRGKRVPIILIPQIKSSIDILNQYRSDCNISEKNPFVFARSNGTLTHLRGHECLRAIADELPLHKPEYITTTKLRKYVATVSQIFEMTPNEQDWLARHMGHDINVHREYYRIHDDTLELAKVSRILLAIDSGEAWKFSGKRLQDIALQDFPELEEEECENEATELELPPPQQSLKCPKLKKGTEINDAKQIKSLEKSALGLQSTGRSVQKKPWSSQDKEACLKFFRVHIKNGRVPGKQDCTALQNKIPSLATRNWTDIKFFIKNHNDKLKKIKSS